MDYEITETLLRALSDVEDQDPDDLEYSLQDYVDPDVIDAMAARGDSDWHLQFSIAAHTITVDCTGLLTIDGHEYRWDSVDT